MHRALYLVLLLLFCLSHQGHAGPIGTVGGGTSLSHATDCTAGGVSGQQGQACVDLDDGKLWTCKTPTAGGVSSVCDSPGDWLATGFTAVGGGISTINAASGTAQTIGGTAPVAVSTNTGTNTTTVALTGPVPATQISTTTTGGVAATTAQAAIAELDTEKATTTDLATAQAAIASLETNKATTTALTTHTADTAPHSATSANTPSRIVTRDGAGSFAATTITGNLAGNATSASSAATLTGKTTVGTGTDLRLSTGAFATDDYVKVDASGNLVTAGAGAGGGGSQSLQEVADIGRTITNANDAATQACIGGTDTGTEYKWCWYGNAAEGPVQRVYPAGDMRWSLSEAFTLQILASNATPIATFDDETKTLIVPNQIVSPGIVKQFSAATAPTINDDSTDGFAVHSQWIETTSDPDVIYICTDASGGAAVWVPYSSFVQVDKGLNDAFNIDKNIVGANSAVNAQCTGDGTGKKCEWYDGATGWHEEVTPAQHQSQDIPATFAYILRYNGTEIVRWDSTGNEKWANQGKKIISIPWSAGGVETDGVNCATQAQSEINTGVRVQDFGCVAFATSSGSFYGLLEMRPAWDAADANTAGIPFTLRLRTIGTSSLIWRADVALYCISDGDVFPTDATFNGLTAQEIDITTLTTANVRRSDTTTAIIPGGTCAVGDSLAFRVKTKSGHTATAAAAKVIGGYLGAKYLQLGD